MVGSINGNIDNSHVTPRPPIVEPQAPKADVTTALTKLADAALPPQLMVALLRTVLTFQPREHSEPDATSEGEGRTSSSEAAQGRAGQDRVVERRGGGEGGRDRRGSGEAGADSLAARLGLAGEAGFAAALSGDAEGDALARLLFAPLVPLVEGGQVDDFLGYFRGLLGEVVDRKEVKAALVSLFETLRGGQWSALFDVFDIAVVDAGAPEHEARFAEGRMAYAGPGEDGKPTLFLNAAAFGGILPKGPLTPQALGQALPRLSVEQFAALAEEAFHGLEQALLGKAFGPVASGAGFLDTVLVDGRPASVRVRVGSDGELVFTDAGSGRRLDPARVTALDEGALFALDSLRALGLAEATPAAAGGRVTAEDYVVAAGRIIGEARAAITNGIVEGGASAEIEADARLERVALMRDSLLRTLGVPPRWTAEQAFQAALQFHGLDTKVDSATWEAFFAANFDAEGHFKGSLDLGMFTGPDADKVKLAFKDAAYLFHAQQQDLAKGVLAGNPGPIDAPESPEAAFKLFAGALRTDIQQAGTSDFLTERTGDPVEDTKWQEFLLTGLTDLHRIKRGLVLPQDLANHALVQASMWVGREVIEEMRADPNINWQGPSAADLDRRDLPEKFPVYKVTYKLDGKTVNGLFSEAELERHEANGGFEVVSQEKVTDPVQVRMYWINHALGFYDATRKPTYDPETGALTSGASAAVRLSQAFHAIYTHLEDAGALKQEKFGYTFFTYFYHRHGTRIAAFRDMAPITNAPSISDQEALSFMFEKLGVEPGSNPLFSALGASKGALEITAVLEYWANGEQDHKDYRDGDARDTIRDVRDSVIVRLEERSRYPGSDASLVDKLSHDGVHREIKGIENELKKMGIIVGALAVGALTGFAAGAVVGGLLETAGAAAGALELGELGATATAAGEAGAEGVEATYAYTLAVGAASEPVTTTLTASQLVAMGIDIDAEIAAGTLTFAGVTEASAAGGTALASLAAANAPVALAVAGASAGAAIGLAVASGAEGFEPNAAELDADPNVPGDGQGLSPNDRALTVEDRLAAISLAEAALKLYVEGGSGQEGATAAAKLLMASEGLTALALLALPEEARAAIVAAIEDDFPRDEVDAALGAGNPAEVAALLASLPATQGWRLVDEIRQEQGPETAAGALALVPTEKVAAILAEGRHATDPATAGAVLLELAKASPEQAGAVLTRIGESNPTLGAQILQALIQGAAPSSPRGAAVAGLVAQAEPQAAGRILAALDDIEAAANGGRLPDRPSSLQIGESLFLAGEDSAAAIIAAHFVLSARLTSADEAAQLLRWSGMDQDRAAEIRRLIENPLLLSQAVDPELGAAELRKLGPEAAADWIIQNLPVEGTVPPHAAIGLDGPLDLAFDLPPVVALLLESDPAFVGEVLNFIAEKQPEVGGHLLFRVLQRDPQGIDKAAEWLSQANPLAAGVLLASLDEVEATEGRFPGTEAVLHVLTSNYPNGAAVKAAYEMVTGQRTEGDGAAAVLPFLPGAEGTTVPTPAFYELFDDGISDVEALADILGWGIAVNPTSDGQDGRNAVEFFQVRDPLPLSEVFDPDAAYVGDTAPPGFETREIRLTEADGSLSEPVTVIGKTSQFGDKFFEIWDPLTKTMVGVVSRREDWPGEGEAWVDITVDTPAGASRGLLEGEGLSKEAREYLDALAAHVRRNSGFIVEEDGDGFDGEGAVKVRGETIDAYGDFASAVYDLGASSEAIHTAEQIEAELGLSKADAQKLSELLKSATAAIFKHGGSFVVAFAGSQPPISGQGLQDWVQNSQTALGQVGAEHQAAIDLGVALRELGVGVGGFTGHSKGGGLALSAMLAYGDREAKVITFDGQLLNDAQLAAALSAGGLTETDLPEILGTNVRVNGAGLTKLQLENSYRPILPELLLAKSVEDVKRDLAADRDAESAAMSERKAGGPLLRARDPIGEIFYYHRLNRILGNLESSQEAGAGDANVEAEQIAKDLAAKAPAAASGVRTSAGDAAATDYVDELLKSDDEFVGQVLSALAHSSPEVGSYLLFSLLNREGLENPEAKAVAWLTQAGPLAAGAILAALDSFPMATDSEDSTTGPSPLWSSTIFNAMPSGDPKTFATFLAYQLEGGEIDSPEGLPSVAAFWAYGPEAQTDDQEPSPFDVFNDGPAEYNGIASILGLIYVYDPRTKTLEFIQTRDPQRLSDVFEPDAAYVSDEAPEGYETKQIRLLGEDGSFSKTYTVVGKTSGFDSDVFEIWDPETQTLIGLVSKREAWPGETEDVWVDISIDTPETQSRDLLGTEDEGSSGSKESRGFIQSMADAVGLSGRFKARFPERASDASQQSSQKVWRQLPDYANRAYNIPEDKAAINTPEELQKELGVDASTAKELSEKLATANAAFYRDESTGQLIFSGAGTDNMKDVKQDAVTAVGGTGEQIKAGIEIGQVIQDKGIDVAVYTGHSKGGQVADAANRAAGGKGQWVGFDSAALNKAQKEAANEAGGITSEDQIEGVNFRMEGPSLSDTMEAAGYEPTGKQVVLPSDRPEKAEDDDPGDPFSGTTESKVRKLVSEMERNHKMLEIKAAYERERADKVFVDMGGSSQN